MFLKKAICLTAAALFCISAASCGNTEGGTVTDGGSGTTADIVTTEAPAVITEYANARQKTGQYMINPVSSITSIGDPFVLLDDDGTYYMYCTSGGFKVWKSTNLSSWEYIGTTYSKTSKSFGDSSYWAPEVYKYNGKYYMFYSAKKENSIHSIGVAVSDSPAGPFTDLYDTPLFSPSYSVIDANVLFDDDGRIYLFYSKDCSTNIVGGIHTSQIYGVELKSDFSGITGTPVLISTPDTAWEKKSGNSYRWNEGPCVFRENGTYYLLYTANCYTSVNYAVGYATSDSPLGTYKKSAANPILKADGVLTSGTGHCNIVRSPDGSEIFMVYHEHTDIANPSGDRTPAFDRLIIHEDETLSVNGPTVWKQPLPSGAAGLYVMKSGYTVSGSYAQGSTEGDASVLADGAVSFGVPDVYDVSGDGYIEMAFESAVTLNSLWIYSSAYSLPESIDLLINDKYMIKGVLPASGDGRPTVVTLRNLPDGITVENIKIYLTVQSRLKHAGLVEITVITEG